MFNRSGDSTVIQLLLVTSSIIHYSSWIIRHHNLLRKEGTTEYLFDIIWGDVSQSGNESGFVSTSLERELL